MADCDSEPTTFVIPVGEHSGIKGFLVIDNSHTESLESMRKLIEPICEGFNHFQTLHGELAWIGRKF